MIRILCVTTLLVVSSYAFAADIKDGVVHIDQQELLEKVKGEDTVLIDVRTAEEYADGHLPGAVNIPHKNILRDNSLLEEYKDKDIILYCHTGVRVKRVTDVLTKKRDNIFHLKGDIRKWKASGRELVQP